MKPTRRPLAALLVAAIAAAVVGCREETPSPTEPPSAPAAAAIAATAALSFRQISAGHTHACGVTSDSLAYCWGFNFSGQLGNGTNTGPDRCGVWPCSTRPVAVAGGLRFRHVNAGHDHTCGVTGDERVYCWGQNINGQLGDGTTQDRLTPVAVSGGRRFRQVRAGGNFTCAINPSDVAFCWGANSSGTVGDGTNTDRLMPTRVAGGLRWRQLNGGTSHACGVTTDDRAWCWGNNGNGQIGNGTSGTVLTKPTVVSGGLRFGQIDAGYAHTCAVTTADRAYCWGYDGFGQVGDGRTATIRKSPLAVVGTRRFDHVTAGGVHSCGVTLAGKGFCWGANYLGQLGDGTTTRRLTPKAISLAPPLSQVSAGYEYTCAATADHRAFCWGDNTYGQLGDGTGVNSSTPVAVAGN